MQNTSSDLFLAQNQPTKARHIYKVSEITRDIKLILENTFAEVWVEGEVSNFRQYPSGHQYFSLKDESALLAAVIFSRNAGQIKFKVEDGLKVICFGRIDLYQPRGQYQLIIEKIEPKGIGGLQLALEQLKQKLEKEGLFSEKHKRPLPYLPSRIGVVTSSSGAAIKDILKVLDRRFSAVEVILNPVRVQGDGAAQEIAGAIEELNLFNAGVKPKERIEAMIVGRGGGSIEDLWAFNDEKVARAIYNSRIPVVSAVGHERDWTIADLVADVRAATPSVAAELVIPPKEELKEKINRLAEDIERAFSDIAAGLGEAVGELARRMNLGAQNLFKLNLGKFESSRKKLELLSPAALLNQHWEKTADLFRQIIVRMQHFLRLREAEFFGLAEKLSSLSPLNILGRGYSITFKLPQGKTIKDSRGLSAGDIIKTKLHKGEVLSQVTEVV